MLSFNLGVRFLPLELDNSLVPDWVAQFVPFSWSLSARIVQQPLLFVLNLIGVHLFLISFDSDDRSNSDYRLLELLIRQRLSNVRK